MKIIAMTASRIPLALSNFVSMSGEGYTKDTQYFKDVVNAAGFNAKRIAAALSQDPKIFNSWVVVTDSENMIKLKTTDYCGNVSFLIVNK